ncbi:hypothetical protein STEG23_007697 [Scotinomys teguina]
MCRLSWFLDPGGWSKTAAVGLYFIFPGICTLSLISKYDILIAINLVVKNDAELSFFQLLGLCDIQPLVLGTPGNIRETKDSICGLGKCTVEWLTDSPNVYQTF